MYYHILMGIVRKIVSAIAAVSLAVVFIGAGFLACTMPPVTGMLANTFSDDVTSPFSRTELVKVANATRDYSFGSHDSNALYRVLYDVDLNYQQQVEEGGGTVPLGFPDLNLVGNPDDAQQVAAAFATASEMYCYSPETVSHLDDCYRLAAFAYPLIAILAGVGLVGLVFVGVTGRKRAVGHVLLAAGIVVFVAFAGLSVWAALDFTGFFTMFHNLFFSQGNWTFPFDSLLICALPTPFWAGMGVVWLVVTVFASVLSIIVGSKLTRRR